MNLYIFTDSYYYYPPTQRRCRGGGQDLGVDGGEGKYKLNKISEKNAFILEDNLWQVVEPGNPNAANEEDAEPSLGVLKMVVKPLVRNVNNISMEMLATALVSESEEL